MYWASMLGLFLYIWENLWMFSKKYTFPESHSEEKNATEAKKFLRHIFSRLTFEDRVMRIRSEACTFPAVISEDKNERPQCLL